ncbi:MAG TPA: PfkB family carbohydrate kinase [Terracidiphilus sp.]
MIGQRSESLQNSEMKFSSAESVLETLRCVRDARITVFGDFCVDAYWDMCEDRPELSVETAVPVRRVMSQRYSLGGAGNVLANLSELGVRHVRAVGLAGTDIFGTALRSMLESSGADTTGFLIDAEWETMVYAKPYYGIREDSRIDFGTFNSVRPDLCDLLLRGLEAAVVESDVVILNQQIRTGLSSSDTIQRINKMIAAHPETTFLADGRHFADKYRGAVLKLNTSEAVELLEENAEHARTEAQAIQLALRISRKTAKPAFLTRGELGIVVAMDDQATVIPGLQVLERTDTVGAGDAVVAALAASLAVGASPVHAATVANIAAMITVKKLQTTGTASADEIVAATADLNYVFQPELANSPRQARYIPDTEIEVIGDLPGDLEIAHCIFDHDGTLSVLREGWEGIMEPMMLRAILGAQHDTVEEVVFERVRATVKQFIDRTTGIQTLVQMKGLADLVRQARFVPAAEVLDEHGYKHIYNQELLKMVNARTEKLIRGELALEDFQIKNARLLLEELHRRGIKLYLASGTDQEDVIAEAEVMGYAHLFDGRIFGAVGDIKVEAKKVVLEKIIREHALSGHEFATFGDGPVELRETQRRGGLCIGVASDECRRFGLNLSKRKRLIRAGANLIVPDYSQLPALLKAMRLN